VKRIRFAGRLTLAAVGLAFVALVGLQFANIVARNVAVAHEVSVSRAELAALRAKERRQLRTIARLNDPRGAIPEIHDKLRLVGPHEELIFIEGLPSPTPEPESGF
jgi:cell division protein FtsB